MSENLQLMTSAIIRVVQTSSTWKDKKVKKTGLCVNLFAKAAKVLLRHAASDSSINREVIITEGARLVQTLSTACDEDKAMSNLKGKSKEIQAVCKAAQ